MPRSLVLLSLKYSIPTTTFVLSDGLNVKVGLMAFLSLSTPCLKLPESSIIALTLTASVSSMRLLRSTDERLWSYAPPCIFISFLFSQAASLTTRLITPPTPPRPKIIPLGPINTSTRSIL